MAIQYRIRRAEEKSSAKIRILVTGSHGFLGSAFVKLLENTGIPFVRYERGTTDLAGTPFNCVVHFGGITPPTAKDGAIYADFAEANVEGTRRLLAALREKIGLCRFVNIGSASEFGAAPGIVSEDAPERPTSDYGRSKVAQTRLVEQFARETGITVANLRVFNIAGLRMRRAAGMVAVRPTVFDSIIEQLEVGSRVAITNRRIVRDFVDVDDVATAALQAATIPKLSGYQLINVATGTGISLGEIAEIIGRQLGKMALLIDIKKHHDISIGNPAKANKLLKWTPRVPIEDSIRRMIGKRSRVLIIGAGVAGRAIVRDLAHEGRSGLVVAGLVDDDPRKQGLRIGEARVVGRIADLPRLVSQLAVDQVLVSTPSVGSGLTAQVAELLPPGFPIRVLPSASSVLLGKAGLSQVREIDPSDLVGRPLVKADQKVISRHVKGKVFIVTGGAGSIGSEIVRQLCSSRAKRVVLFDAWEEGVFNLCEELKPALGAPGQTELIARIGNVRDRARLKSVMAEFRPHAIIHAAAYKHVPLMEDNPQEAYKTNVSGTRNVLDVAAQFNVTDFVMISTDKAVRPSSTMGLTKRKAELLVKAYGRKYRKRRHMVVRFGNVLNSSGSVIPTFLRQIRRRQPVTVTHPEMTRYFMSIPEAVSLVLMAWIVGKNTQVLLLDMGQPERVLDLALRLIRIHGLEPYKDIDIKFIGIRPGEKLHEELAYDGALKKSPADRIMIAEEG